MNAFAWLLIGHLFGDWVLQSDWMARGKRQRLFTWAGAAHFGVYTAAVMVALGCAGIPSKNPTLYILASAVVYGSHWLIDATNAAQRWLQCCLQSNSEVVRSVIDQTFHLIVLAALLEWLSMMDASLPAR